MRTKTTNLTISMSARLNVAHRQNVVTTAPGNIRNMDPETHATMKLDKTYQKRGSPDIKRSMVRSMVGSHLLEGHVFCQIKKTIEGNVNRNATPEG